MKLISWNVNGFRAILGKGFADIFEGFGADVVCLQETKMQPGQAEFSPPGYHQYWYSAEKKGYSGTAVFTRMEPLSVRYGIGKEEHSHEGRAITLEFDSSSSSTSIRPTARMNWRACPTACSGRMICALICARWIRKNPWSIAAT